MPKLFQYNGREWIEISKDGKDGSPDTAQQIIDKIKGVLSYRDLKDTPEFPAKLGWAGQGYLKELPDYQEFINKLSGGQISVGGVEVLVGTQNDSNTVFTISHTPKYITFNGQAIYEGAGYSLSGLTITLDLAPSANDILRSHF